ncbi:MAG: hypothetical protein RL660_62 [Bacteroidota bacterium]|jgi:hypothetical protein
MLHRHRKIKMLLLAIFFCNTACAQVTSNYMLDDLFAFILRSQKAQFHPHNCDTIYSYDPSSGHFCYLVKDTNAQYCGRSLIVDSTLTPRNLNLCRVNFSNEIDTLIIIDSLGLLGSKIYSGVSGNKYYMTARQATVLGDVISTKTAVLFLAHISIDGALLSIHFKQSNSRRVLTATFQPTESCDYELKKVRHD